MNWKNTAENLFLVLIGIVAGTIIGHKITKVTSESLTEILKPTIEKAIDKETISNTISNAIDLKIDKIKKSDTLQISINQEPFNDLNPTSTINKSADCVVSQSQFLKLSSSRKNRIERWLKD
jgi:hypothetical protein